MRFKANKENKDTRNVYVMCNGSDSVKSSVNLETEVKYSPAREKSRNKIRKKKGLYIKKGTLKKSNLHKIIKNKKYGYTIYK